MARTPYPHAWTSGVIDGYATSNNNEYPTPSTALRQWVLTWQPANANNFRYDLPDNSYGQVWAHTFGGFAPPSERVICKGTLTLRVHSRGANDELGLPFVDVNGAPMSGYFKRSLADLDVSSGQDKSIVLDLTNLAGANGPVNVLPTIASLGYLDVYVQNDTRVDYAELALEYCKNPSVQPVNNKRGMTWTQYYVMQGGEPVPYDSCNQPRVGCNDCDGYQGDTLCTEERPILCLLEDGSENACEATEPAIFNDGWAGGTIALTTNIRGIELTSQAVADTICADTFGPGYRMAEFHDGGGGWSYRANGSLDGFNTSSTPSSTHPRFGNPNQGGRFWVWINDQQANCWN
jgi:hypothetical protein